MGHKKRVVGFVVGALVLAAILLAQPLIAVAQTTLEFWHPFSQATRQEALKLSAQDFEEANPGVKVKIEVVPFTKIIEKWTSAYAAGILPDIMGTSSPFAPAMDAVGIIKYTNSLIEEMGGKEEVFTLPKLIDNEWTVDGNILGMPLYGVLRLPAYRKDLLDEKGLLPPASWEEWIDVVGKLTDPPNQYGLVQMWDAGDMGGIYPVFQFMRSNNGTVFDKDGNLAFNTPENIEAVGQIMELYKVGSPANEFSFTMRDYFSLFTSGKSAISLSSSGFLADSFERNAPELAAQGALGFFRGPVRLQRSWIAAGTGFVLLKGDNEDLATKFAKSLLEGDGYIRFLHAVPVGMLPVTNAAAQSPEYWDNPLIKKYSEAVVAQIEGLREGANICATYGSSVGTTAAGQYGIIETMLQKIAVGQVSVEEGVVWAEKEIAKKIEELERAG